MNPGETERINESNGWPYSDKSNSRLNGMATEWNGMGEKYVRNAIVYVLSIYNFRGCLLDKCGCDCRSFLWLFVCFVWSCAYYPSRALSPALSLPPAHTSRQPLLYALRFIYLTTFLLLFVCFQVQLKYLADIALGERSAQFVCFATVAVAVESCLAVGGLDSHLRVCIFNSKTDYLPFFSPGWQATWWWEMESRPSNNERKNNDDDDDGERDGIITNDRDGSGYRIWWINVISVEVAAR